MTWRDRLQRASFRGVEFRVEAHQSGSSRRVVPFEFPGRDEKVVQDLGRGLDVVRLRAYVIGPDYDRQRDALLAACRRAGPGTLVHPYLGRLEVRCTDFRVEERSTVGGLAVFTLAFIEAGGTAQGLFRADVAPVAAASEAAETLRTVAVDSWQERIAAAGPPGRSALAIAGRVRALADYVRALPYTGPAAEVASLLRDGRALADAAIDLVAVPSDLAGSVREIVVGIASAFESRRARVAVLLDLLEQSPTRSAAPVSGLFASRAASEDATDDLIRALAAAQVVDDAGEADWEFLGQATAALERLQAGVDELADRADAATYGALTGLVAAAPDVMPTEPASLPELERVELGRSAPALVVAYERYGDASRDGELAARNPRAVRHPGRLPAAETLEVLSS